MYKLVHKWACSCEVCQRVQPAPSLQARLCPLPIATEVWNSVSMDFVFGLPADAQGRTGGLVIVDRLGKIVHLSPVVASITAEETAYLFIDMVFRHHGMPATIVLNRDTCFITAFWSRLFEISGTRLILSTGAHPETDDQTERVNRVF
ncbi:unnamed protein product [Peronospora belbahrii]|uniref:Integrase catalytic domain-containing protein n=1 Tax=Peronospora belbahrii TaxID=622444 RepID=A0AAU9LK74_9STRA|nr:unnamed protein product [Peronospora belbahrii]